MLDGFREKALPKGQESKEDLKISLEGAQLVSFAKLHFWGRQAIASKKVQKFLFIGNRAAV